MHFEIETLGPARKQVRIEIPARRVDSTFATVYNQLAQKASLPGFRKGKVPMSHVRKLYGDRARFSVTERLVDAGWRELLDTQDVIPLSEPELDAAPVAAGEAFAFTMTFDVAPEIELKPFDELSIEKESWIADDATVEHELIHLAEQVAEYQPVSDRTTAQEEDQVIIDYAGSINGEAFEGGTATDAPLVLGSGRFIPGFEEQIVGKNVGDSFDVNVSFPDEYPAEHLRGQEALFSCTLKEIQAKQIPEVGPALAEKVGEKDLETLKERMKEEIEGRFNGRAQTDARDSLRVSLGGQYDFEVPPTLLKSSLEDHRAALTKEAIQGGQSEIDAAAEVASKMGDEEVNVIRDIRAYLVMDLVAQNENIEVTDDDLRNELQQMMRTMGPYAQQIIQMYSDPERRAGLARRIRHDKVLDFLLTQANVTSVEREVPVHDCQHDDHAHSVDA